MVAETTMAIVIPILMIAFHKHRLLFSFDYQLFENSDGTLNASFICMSAAIQITGVLISIIGVSMIEGYYNNLSLSYVLSLRLVVGL